MTLLIAFILIQAHDLSSWWYVWALIVWVCHCCVRDLSKTEKQVAALHRLAVESAKARGIKL